MGCRVLWGGKDGVQGVNGVAGAQEQGYAKDTGTAQEVLGRVGLGAKAAPPPAGTPEEGNWDGADPEQELQPGETLQRPCQNW